MFLTKLKLNFRKVRKRYPSKEKARAKRTFWLLSWARVLELAVVVLDDLGFVDLLGKLVALGFAEVGAAELGFVDFDIADGGGLGFKGFLDAFERAVTFEGDHVVDGAEIGGDVDLLAVDEDVAMVDELSGTGAGPGEAHAIDEVV